MRPAVLDPVVLAIDLPAHDLRAGDVGVVVERYEPSGIEVEFVSGDGQTQALVTLADAEVRALGNHEILAVRSLSAA